MRKTVLGLIAALVLSSSGLAFAQISKEEMKERKELAKASKKELEKKAIGLHN